jgi:hypothetical protein
MGSSKPPSHHPDDGEPRANWFDRFARLETSFARYARDIGGILTLSLALMLLLALIGLTEGVFLGAVADFLLIWLGLGSLFIVALILWGGVALVWRERPKVKVGVTRVVAMELCAFLLLALLSYIGPWLAQLAGDLRAPLERAEAGIDGGRVGWAIAELLDQLVGPTVGLLLVLAGLTVCIVVAFGLAPAIEAWLFRLSGQSVPGVVGESPDLMNVLSEPDSLPSDLAAPVNTNAKKKAGVVLPPEFRKALKMPEAQDEKPAEPRIRGERLPPLNRYWVTSRFVLMKRQSIRLRASLKRHFRNSVYLPM